MKEREYGDYVQDILDSICDIGKFTEGMDFDYFAKDKKVIYAVIRAIEIIGEATKKYPKVNKGEISGGPLEENGWNEGQIGS